MAIYYGKAEDAAQGIVNLFKSGNVPKALSLLFIKRQGIPCCAWSWSNQLLTALAGYDDARGFRQWEAAGRYVKKGEKAFHILAPLARKVKETTASGESVENLHVYGFKAVPVFGYEQTDGQPLPDRENERTFVATLPLIEVARHWGLNVHTYNGQSKGYLGYYTPSTIALGVENLATWAHELVHAADDRRGELRKSDKVSREVVAELGAAVLLTVIGRTDDADYGGCWTYIESYAREHGKPAATACEQLLRRTCEAVAMILETANEVAAATAPAETESTPVSVN